jgi:hypothetical protein
MGQARITENGNDVPDKPAAANIRGYIAFWRGVKVED